MAFGALAKGKAIARLVDGRAVLRAVEDFEVTGRSAKRPDGVEQVTGRALFAADIRRPGMLHARILGLPAHGAEATSVDISKVKALDGVTVVQEEDLVVVLHSRRTDRPGEGESRADADMLYVGTLGGTLWASTPP